MFKLDLTAVSDLLKGSVPDTLLKLEIFGIDPIPFIYHALAVVNTVPISLH